MATLAATRWRRQLPLLLLVLLAVSTLATDGGDVATLDSSGEDPAASGDAPSAPAPAPYDCSGPSATGDSFLDYDHLVHCAPLLQSSPTAGKATLVIVLVVLLYLLSSTADEFFCPVLQAIVEKYHIPPDVAGVTFLSFGNGSPDVFSNIAAFATPTPSIGVTAILGGGLLVTTVITACVGLISDGQEQLIPRTYTRDVTFYFVGILYLGFVFFDGKVELAEAAGFLIIYLCYVLVVFMDKHLATCCFPSALYPEDTLYAVLDDNDELQYWSSSSASEKSSVGSPALYLNGLEPSQQPHRPFLKSTTIPIYDAFARSHIFSDSEQSETSPRFFGRTLYRKSSVPTPRSKSHLGDEEGSVARDEGQSLLEVTDVHLRRPSSMCVSTMQDSLRRIRRHRRRRKTAWESLETSAHFGPTARRWTRGYHTLSDIEEFPTTNEAGEEAQEEEEGREDAEAQRKETEAEAEAAETAQLVWEANMAASTLERVKIQVKRCIRWVTSALRSAYWAFERFVWNPFEVFTVFVRRLTIPLVDEDTWDKNLAVVCPPFAMFVVGVSVFSFSVKDPVFLGTVALVGGILSAIIEFTASPQSPPEGWQLAPFICLAFVMSVIWIMNIANEVLAVLETLGGLFNISSSVLGVSVSEHDVLQVVRKPQLSTDVLRYWLVHWQVLAWGNSIGDLVSNMAIARDGFPTMAFAGCFAGPMFNLLVGIGLSLTIHIVSHGPLSMGEPSPLVYLGFGYLLSSLVVNLGMASYDGFRYRTKLCYTLLTLYASFAVISVAVVLSYPQE
ncbi:hypothetical protein BBJ28_00000172 [Nothophytophthora sp. Chile5]|nr:hypothetical protein BBJ28_00000172 [Nothophytophthora sp. Chile5]